jgi:serine/threonine-protein kinase PknG
MQAQLLLIQYEVVATLRGDVEAPRSTIFTPELQAAVDNVDPNALPKLLDRSGEDVPLPLEASIRAAQSLLDAGRIEEVEAVCTSIEAADPHEWRATWLRGVAALRRGEISAARKCFDQVYARIPGETGPKLALAFAAESERDFRCAIRLYDTVSRTSPATTSAAFGLARCSVGLGERQRTLDAYRRVPHGARSWVRARVGTVRALIQQTDSYSPTWPELVAASDVLDGIDLEPPQRAELESQLLGEALELLRSGDAPPGGVTSLVGSPLTERDLRSGIESAYRTLARYSARRSERIIFIDRANSVRARSWI